MLLPRSTSPLSQVLGSHLSRIDTEPLRLMSISETEVEELVSLPGTDSPTIDADTVTMIPVDEPTQDAPSIKLIIDNIAAFAMADNMRGSDDINQPIPRPDSPTINAETVAMTPIDETMEDTNRIQSIVANITAFAMADNMRGNAGNNRQLIKSIDSSVYSRATDDCRDEDIEVLAMADSMRQSDSDKSVHSGSATVTADFEDLVVDASDIFADSEDGVAGSDIVLTNSDDVFAGSGEPDEDSDEDIGEAIARYRNGDRYDPERAKKVLCSMYPASAGLFARELKNASKVAEPISEQLDQSCKEEEVKETKRSKRSRCRKRMGKAVGTAVRFGKRHLRQMGGVFLGRSFAKGMGGSYE